MVINTWKRILVSRVERGARRTGPQIRSSADSLYCSTALSPSQSGAQALHSKTARWLLSATSACTCKSQGALTGRAATCIIALAFPGSSIGRAGGC